METMSTNKLDAEAMTLLRGLIRACVEGSGIGKMVDQETEETIDHIVELIDAGLARLAYDGMTNDGRPMNLRIEAIDR